jgi:hypothetical protein
MISQHAAESSKAKLVTLSPTPWAERHKSAPLMVQLPDPTHYTEWAK